MIDLATCTANTTIQVHAERGGISIHLRGDDASISPTWNLGGFTIQFAALPTGDCLRLDPHDKRTYLKVIAGEVDCPPYRPFPARGEIVSTEITESEIRAVRNSTLCIISEANNTPATITSMSQLGMSGPMSEYLEWQSFNEKFGAVTDIFEGLEAHMLPGFHLLDAAGDEIAYVHFWTTGKGVDVSTHDHGNAPSELAPAFAETHLVLRNGTGQGAMYQCDAPGATHRQRLVIQAGEEHGPFFRFDAVTGKPKMRDNGAVDYPWHGWQGGTDADIGESYDLVTAFEISPDYTRAC